MQRVPVNELRPGMLSARNIYNAEGNLLLAADRILTASQIRRLISQQAGSVYIHNELLGEVEIPEMIREETRIKSIRTVQRAFCQYKPDSVDQAADLENVVSAILDEVIGNHGVMLHLTDIRLYDDYTFGHSVNVCALSLMLGSALGFSEPKLRDLGMGALLHDIGKIVIPQEILNKPGKLTNPEMKVMQGHPERGFDILRRQKALSLVASHVALAHHEKMDGSGYPRGLPGDQIPDYSRVVAIADIYDAITSDRPYREAMLPHEAYDILMSLSANHLDPVILAEFFQRISIYPIGSVVELASGEYALVTAVYSGVPWRPVVKIFTDSSGILIEKPWELDLTKNLTAVLKRVLHFKECALKFGQFFLHGQRKAAQGGS